MIASPQTPIDALELLQAVQALPPEAQRAVLHFALFLQTRISTQDTEWDAAFAQTDSTKLKAWLENERAADADDDLQPTAGLLNSHHEYRLSRIG